MRALTATCRLQLDAEFTFARARAAAPYLKRLGVSHLYLSPVLKSRSGSEHGYDVVDPTHVDPELGGEEGWDALVSTLRELEMGIVLDIVPNHMGVSPENPYLEDVFSHGPASRYAGWFDIDWTTPQRDLGQRVLAPVLGDDLDRVIEAGEIDVGHDGGRFRVRYHEHHFPIDPRTIPVVLGMEDATDRSRTPSEPGSEPGPGPASEPEMEPEVARLHELAQALAELPPRSAGRPDLVERRQREAPELQASLARLLQRSERVKNRVEEGLRDFSEGEGAPERLRSFLDTQAYALADWRRADTDINYRRFFNINELVALRVEDPEVFTRTHERILRWVGSGQVDALRIDHVDGLRDPEGYLERLRATVTERVPEGRGAGLPVLVEKILSPGEHLRREWPVQGTTGYEFLNDVESLFVAAPGMARIERSYRRHIGLTDSRIDFSEMAYRGKLQILRTSLEADVHRLGRLLGRILHGESPARTLERGDVTETIIQFIACLPVYRTYVRPQEDAVNPEDRRWIRTAADRVRERRAADSEVLDKLTQILLLEEDEIPTGEERRLRTELVQRFQQTTGAATAKGVEDTALYRYTPLASLNEVGGAPDRDLTTAVETLHRGNEERARHWPSSMVTVDTHDTKRSADLRSRLDVLSEIPDEWGRVVRRWRKLNEPHRTRVGRRWAPDPNAELLLYQTLVGMWPLGPSGAVPPAEARIELRERLGDYLLKAVREAKQATSWTEPDPAFEEGLLDFLDPLLEPDRSPFLDEVVALVERIGPAGMWNALARSLVHLTAPGIPDLYQGGELWNFALVDPDNRRPVDFGRREDVLKGIEDALGSGLPGNPPTSPGDGKRSRRLRDLLARPEDGRLKMFVIHRTLSARRADPTLFATGEYLRIESEGAAAAHVFAFARRREGRVVLTAVPRLVQTLAGGEMPVGDDVWKDTRLQPPDRLAEGPWESLLTGDEVGSGLRCAELFGVAPVALVRSGEAR